MRRLSFKTQRKIEFLEPFYGSKISLKKNPVCPAEKNRFLSCATLDMLDIWSDLPHFFQSFFSTFANCCYKFLEHPGINRDKTLRDSILKVLAILVKTYNQSLSVGVKVIQLLQHFEHLISPMVQLVQVCAAEYGMRNIIVDILR